jgi:hypothetical protein
MTVSTTTSSITYQGNGATTSFTFPFAMPANIPVAQLGQYLSVTVVSNVGVSTVIAYGNATTQFQASVNAPSGADPTPVGGTVVYNPPGGPLATGWTITITRTVPDTQPFSLNNQGTILPTVIEEALDNMMMNQQEQAATLANAIVAPFTDPLGLNYTLPSVAARAGQGLVFDAFGNVTTGVLPSSGIISAAMAPVVSAATLAAGRTAFGLGSIVTEAIGPGLTDDGAGNLRLATNTVSDSVSTTVTSAFFATQRIATGPITYTLPLTTGLWSGWFFTIFAFASPVTVTANASDLFKFGNSSSASGGSITIQPGCCVRLTTNASGTWYIDGGSLGINIQRFTINGTYTPTAGMLIAKCTAVGSGAAGGGTPSTSSSQKAVGSGGGGGGISIDWLTAAQIGASQAVTVSPGGTGVADGTGSSGGQTKLGSLLVANGGIGGSAGTAVSSTGQALAGGAGGALGTGTNATAILLGGQPGGTAFVFITSGPSGDAMPGNGGAGYLGVGGGASGLGFGSGQNGTSYGAGGGGAVAGFSQPGNLAGGNGDVGLLLIEEYILQ